MDFIFFNKGISKMVLGELMNIASCSFMFGKLAFY